MKRSPCNGLIYVYGERGKKKRKHKRKLWKMRPTSITNHFEIYLILCWPPRILQKAMAWIICCHVFYNGRIGASNEASIAAVNFNWTNWQQSSINTTWWHKYTHTALWSAEVPCPYANENRSMSYIFCFIENRARCSFPAVLNFSWLVAKYVCLELYVPSW